MADADLSAAAGRFVDMLTGASAHAPAVMEAAGRYLQAQAIIGASAGAALLLVAVASIVWGCRRCSDGDEVGIPGLFFGAIGAIGGFVMLCVYLPSTLSPSLALAGYALSVVRP